MAIVTKGCSSRAKETEKGHTTTQLDKSTKAVG